MKTEQFLNFDPDADRSCMKNIVLHAKKLYHSTPCWLPWQLRQYQSAKQSILDHLPACESILFERFTLCALFLSGANGSSEQRRKKENEGHRKRLK